MALEDHSWTPWLLVLVLIFVTLLVYGRGNSTASRLQNEIQILQVCIQNTSYARDMIERQCLVDQAESGR